MDSIIIIYITVFLLAISCLIKIEERFSNMIQVTSRVNNEIYKVRKFKLKKRSQEAADLLGELHEKLKIVVKTLGNKYPNDERVKRLINRFPNTHLEESRESRSSQTSFSINKGEKIVFCLRSKDKEKKLVDLNLILFVGLHELSHIMTISIGHTDEFWENFKFVLKVAQDSGIYQCINFASKPTKYCGIVVSSSPYPCNT